MIVVSGGPFVGKSRYIRAEIERRERDGELGLLLISYSELFGALVPGVQSSYRDESVGSSGAPRFVGAMYEAAVRQAIDRELDGYTATDSPRRALAIADRFGPDTRIVTVEADEDEIADRTAAHLSALARKVPRARRETRAAGSDGAISKCTQAIIAAIREAETLAGRARRVRRRKGGGGRRTPSAPAPAAWEDVGQVQAFNRALWLAGLTARGRRALQALIQAGNPTPGPADVQRWLIREATGAV